MRWSKGGVSLVEAVLQVYTWREKNCNMFKEFNGQTRFTSHIDPFKINKNEPAPTSPKVVFNDEQSH